MGCSLKSVQCAPVLYIRQCLCVGSRQFIKILNQSSHFHLCVQRVSLTCNMTLTLVEAYKVLSVTSESSPEEVKKAYKKLALRTHPDKNPNDPDASRKFLQISEAYKRITDPNSFHDDEDDQLPNEEEMEAMFNMMFAEMMGMGGGMGEISPEMFAAMEEMMMNGGEDDDIMAAMMFGGHGFDSSDYDSEEGYGGDIGDNELLEMLMHELMHDKPRKPSRSSKSNKFRADGKSMKATGKSVKIDAKRPQQKQQDEGSGSESDSSNWETDDSDQKHKGKSDKKLKSKLAAASNSGFGPSFGMSSKSKRVPPRVSSGFMTATGVSASKSSDRVDSSSADAKDTFSMKYRDAKFGNDELFNMNSSPELGMGARKYSRPQAQAPQSKATTSDIAIGDRVLVQGRHTGKAAFVGSVHYAKGTYVGVVMDDAETGKNNGTIKGTEYFKCPGGTKGLMVPLSDVLRM